MSVPGAEGLDHHLKQAVPESTKLGLKSSDVRARVTGLKANIYYTIGMCRKQSNPLAGGSPRMSYTLGRSRR